jgi:hypothetical protein
MGYIVFNEIGRQLCVLNLVLNIISSNDKPSRTTLVSVSTLCE